MRIETKQLQVLQQMNVAPTSGGHFPSFRRDQGTIVSAMVIIALLLAAGCSREPAPPPTAAKPERKPIDPRVLLVEMIDAYQQADFYSDRGIMRLRVLENGRWVDNEAPMAVIRMPGRKLRVEAYATRLTCDGTRMHARIAATGTPELDQQLLTAPAPEALTLTDLYSDPILRTALLGAAGRQPVQLELLFAEKPLEPALGKAVPRRYLGTRQIGDRECHGVEATLEEGAFVFWIDKEDRVLRRLEYPSAAIFPGLGDDQVELAVDLRDASFDAKAHAGSTFTLRDGPSATVPVAAFVLPPSPLPSRLFGQRVDRFALTDPRGGEVTSRTLDGKIAVLMWFNLHPACKESLQRLAKVQRVLQDESRVVFFAVCTEPKSIQDAQLFNLLAENSARNLTLLRDLAAHGRDLFQIPGAPALVVRDAQGVVQIVEVGVNPGLDEQLPIVVERLLRGDDLAGEVVGQYERDLEQFRNQLRKSSGAGA